MQIITTHTGTDFDGLAATVAARKLYPEAKICLPGSVAKEVKKYFLTNESQCIVYVVDSSREMEISVVTKGIKDVK